MKLSENTLSIFENLVNINQGIIVLKKFSDDTGTLIKSSDKEESFMALVKLSEQFSKNFVIGDVKTFLGVVRTMEDPELKLQDGSVIVHDTNSSMEIRYTEPEAILSKDIFNNVEFTPPTEKLISYELSKINMDKLLKLADIMQHVHIQIDVVKGNAVMRSLNSKNPASNKSEVVLGPVGKVNNSCFPLVLDRTKFRFIKGNYQVDVYENMAVFTNSDGIDIKYFIGAYEK